MIRPGTMPDDGLPTSEVGPWSLQKYRLLDLYDTLFSTGMKHHWDLRVYIWRSSLNIVGVTSSGIKSSSMGQTNSHSSSRGASRGSE